jgi:hypothetical protein
MRDGIQLSEALTGDGAAAKKTLRTHDLLS